VEGSEKELDLETFIAIIAPADFARHELSYALQHSVPSLHSHPQGTGPREIVNGFGSFPERAPPVEAIIQEIKSRKFIVCEVIVSHLACCVSLTPIPVTLHALEHNSV
jgi:hypothetical protein